jgi:hypothetical protein
MTQISVCEEGRYLYCIINSGNEKNFGQIGVEDSAVSVVAFRDIGVVVHSCKAKPYESKSKEKAGEWILAHQYVIDLATEQYGTVIPLTFDTIFKGNDNTLVDWLNAEYAHLKASLAKLEGKAEYGIQIFIKNETFDKVLNKNEEIIVLEKKLENTSSGAGYLLRKKLDQKMQLEKQLIISKYTENLCSQIAKVVDEIKLGSTTKEVPKKWQEHQMILNVTCLAKKEKIGTLGSMLGLLKNEGFAVRFTGPWPPYSFVGQIDGSKIRGN